MRESEELKKAADGHTFQHQSNYLGALVGFVPVWADKTFGAHVDSNSAMQHHLPSPLGSPWVPSKPTSFDGTGNEDVIRFDQYARSVGGISVQSAEQRSATESESTNEIMPWI